MDVAGFLINLFSLTGRTALVTGASSGIGKTIALALAQAGAKVVLVARRAEVLAEVAEEISKPGGTAQVVPADLSKRESIGGLIAMLEGVTIDILVNAAGINLRPPMQDLTESDYDATMRLNLDAPFFLGQAFAPQMAKRGFGRIINIASQQSIRAFGNSGAYGVSKAAILALTRSQSEAWAGQGVCCNAIAPGFIRTPLSEPVFKDPERRAAMAGRTHMGRNGELADIPGTAVFLASRASNFVTGQTIFVDGGMSAQ